MSRRKVTVSQDPRVVMFCCEGRHAGLYRIEGLRSQLAKDLDVKDLPPTVDMERTVARYVGARKTFILYREEWKDGMAPVAV